MAKRHAHVPVLTSIGLGRASGFSIRPFLMCQEFVHACLFQTVMDQKCNIGQNFKFIPSLPPIPKPLWVPPTARTRIIGKQSPKPDQPKLPSQRKVKSHKNTVAGIEWSPEDLAQIETAKDWRQKQQYQKKLLHNHTAASHQKHIIGLERIDKVYRCSLCQRTNSNLSKLMLDTCGGSQDNSRGYHVPRGSVILQKRQKLVQNHNTSRDTQDEFNLPKTNDDPLKCLHCGAADSEGWRRFAKMAKQTCPLAS